MLIVACSIVGLLLLLCICCCVCCCRKMLHKSVKEAGGAHELIEADYSNSKNLDDADQTAHEGPGIDFT